MRPIRSISVLMPTWQGEQFLERVLAALAAQEIDLAWDFTVIDSGSTDRTLAILEESRANFPVPMRVESIHKVEFDHGDTRNLLATRSEGDLLVFLTQDAIPGSPKWLATLAANFADARVAAAYCRNVARPDSELLTRVFCANDPGYTSGRRVVTLPPREVYARMNAHERRLLYNFNDVASAVRREVWERHPFPRTEFGEDVLLARGLLEAGFAIVYDDAATVEHSHDYSVDETRARGTIDGKFNAEWLDRTCVAALDDVRVLVERQLDVDRRALSSSGANAAEFERSLAHARSLREAAFLGLHLGGLSQARRPHTRMLERTNLHILFVIHGFPPDTWAGTEVYTLNLACELVRLGHRVTILTRAPAAKSVADGGPQDFALEQSEFQGLRVWRMIHRLAHDNLRQTFDQPKAVAVFREILLREKPDLVHFQHLIHLSAGLVQEAKNFGLPTVLHCHDYWALCSRVQLIRPDGERCEENQGAGCFLCVRERGLAHVPRMRRVGENAPAVMDELLSGEREGRAIDWTGFGDLMGRQEFVLDAYAAADLRISPSRFLRDRLLATGAFDPRTTLFSDNGQRTDLVSARAKELDPKGRVRFGFVGSLVWYKGVDVLIEAMNRLGGKKALLNVFGEFKPERDEYHERLRSRVRANNVVFRGRFENQHLVEVYSEIDVLVVPSVWFENSPITIKEAFLFRTPVVTSGIGGMAEFVRDGVDGLHFAVGDADDLAAKLARFVDEPNLVGRLSENFPRVKSIAENARELEFRYRSLCTFVRDPVPKLLFEKRGVDTSRRGGPVEQQGADMILLRPGGAFAEYDLSLVGAGSREIELELCLLAPERGVQLAARLVVDGREIGRVDPISSNGRDDAPCFRFAVDFALAPSILRVETKAGEREREHFLRIKRVAVREPSPKVLHELALARVPSPA